MRRSSAILCRTRSLLVASRQRTHGNARLVIPPRLGRTKVPKDTHSDPNSPARPSSGVHTRSSSLKPLAEDEHVPVPLVAHADSPPEPDSPPAPPSEPEKPPRRTRASAGSTASSGQKDRDSDSDDRPQLPQELDILWLPELSPASDVPRSHVLPPHELFEEALTNLHITLHPHTQHRAAYVTPAGPPVEPTLALYCPVEGGEYVIDETVRELARRTGAEVLVIDAVQLAAGEWGHFGKAANAIQLPRNPLHYYPPPSPSNASRRQPGNPDEDDEGDMSPYAPSLGIAQMTLHVLAPAMASRGRQPPVFAASRSASPPNRIKAFFDDLVNLPSPVPSGQRSRPRLVYIRDFPTLAPTAATWYPHLLSAVRARRTGPIARPSSPVACPMAIICGVTPPLVGQSSSSFSPPVFSAYSMSAPHGHPAGRRRHTARPSPAATPGASPSAGSQVPSEWGEDEHATRARERRLRERLRRWERGGDSALLEDVPRLLTTGSMGSASGPSPSPTSASSSSSPFVMSPYAQPEADSGRSIVLLGSTPVDLMGGEGEGGEASPASAGANGRFFRASVVLPSTRDAGIERQCRMARRREMNELAMRMGVGGVGGMLEECGRDAAAVEGVHSGDITAAKSIVEDSSEDVASAQSDTEPDNTRASAVSSETSKHDPEAPSTTSYQLPEEHEMWADWSTRVEPWSSIRQIADRAVGSVVATQPSSAGGSSPGLEPTAVPWSAIHRAWAAQRSSHELRRAWTKDARVRITRGPQQEDGIEEDAEEIEGEEGEEGAGKYVDEVVEAVKQDKDLDPHEQRLLGCIVDSASLSTTFAHVHLPQHTIDSVRTLVSLPLLYPAAFQTGILREHAMTGCLLFGPPGTGKTLIVRALAKEAGSRMLMVSPSDVMDMYVGEGEKLVRAVFSLARRLSPCVVFLDEIDALFGARTSAHNSGGVIAHRGVITEFMQEMDGLKSRAGEERVIVIGATNRPFDLDDAVLRRLPRRLLVDLPGEKEREGILKILLRDEILSPDIDLKALAKRTESFSGSDLKHLCVSAALAAVKDGVELPWSTPSSATTDGASPSPSDTPEARIIYARHFAKALKEITPSSSETLGSLADLRKWNEQFGEGRKDKRRVQVWGKGRFGFTDAMVEAGQDEGRVAGPDATARGRSSIEQ